MRHDAPVLSRRRLLGLSGGALALAVPGPAEAQAPADDLPAALRALQPMTDGVAPITADEHRARLVRAQRLLAESGLDAMVVGPGSSLAYFTGAEWGLSERFLGIVLGRSGDPVWVVPSFEEDRAREQVRVGTDVRAWHEDESPYALVAQALADRGAAAGRVGVEETMPFAFSDGIGQARPAARLASAVPVTAGCRSVKDAHEIALMRRACAITLTAYRAVFASLAEGQTVAQVSGWVAAAHRRLGARGGALVLFGSDAAFPHGTSKPRALQKGDVVLVDGGCRVHGYQSDVTRTAVFGAPPTDRQRLLWDLVRRAQVAAFEAARPGVECQAVDAAARRVVEEGGFGPGYAYFTHRLGHGIGLDGHEWPYMVRGNATKLAAGVTFTDEPGIYVPGELGIRHEDTVAVTESGCENLCPKWSGTPEEPAIV
ncbi:MAG TPA: Xaa-Pro peptidase family protein [Vicinamibacteria bacterium]